MADTLVSAIIFRAAPKARNRQKQCSMIFLPCEICFAQEMRACARVTRRFRRSAVSVSPRIVFQTFCSGNCSVFPQNPPDLSLRGGRIFCARRGNLKRNDFYTVSAAFGSLFRSSPLPLVCFFKKMMFLEKNA